MHQRKHNDRHHFDNRTFADLFKNLNYIYASCVLYYRCAQELSYNCLVTLVRSPKDVEVKSDFKLYDCKLYKGQPQSLNAPKLRKPR